MNPLHNVNPCQCPLCDLPNRCAMERPQVNVVQEPCWCTREQFNAQLLQRVPEPLKGKACICRACVLASSTAA